MPFSDDELKQLLAVAEHTLRRTGETVIMPAFLQGGSVDTKSDGSVVTETDLAAQDTISAALQAHSPGIPFLGEEMTEGEQLRQLAHGRYWCVDPLDGTTNFATRLPAFATSLALIEEGTPVLACIHDPVRQESFTAIRGAGAFLNGERIIVSNEVTLKEAVGFIDFKRLQETPAIRFATEKFFRSQRNIGSCALEWAWLAAGRAQFIIHGGEKIWDFAAGALLAQEAGCIVSDFGNASLFSPVSHSSSIAAAASTTIHNALLERIRS